MNSNEGVDRLSETFSDQDCVALYLRWRLDKPLDCPACGGHVSSHHDARVGWAGSRLFICDGCGKTGTHLVPDPAPSAVREKPADPGPLKA